MQLFGSTTSPYVRRIRLFLAQQEYQFIDVDIFSEQGREILTQHNPSNKIPFLIDEQHTILDSRQIHRYLASKLQQAELSWSQQNVLTIIDAANDSLVAILLLKRSGFDVTEDKLFFNLQYQRVLAVLTKLEQELAQGSFSQWHYPAICLFCLLDWMSFRQLFDFSQFNGLVTFYQQHQARVEVQATDPRTTS
jgi:glutathione S-transferase